MGCRPIDRRRGPPDHVDPTRTSTGTARLGGREGNPSGGGADTRPATRHRAAGTICPRLSPAGSHHPNARCGWRCPGRRSDGCGVAGRDARAPPQPGPVGAAGGRPRSVHRHGHHRDRRQARSHHPRRGRPSLHRHFVRTSHPRSHHGAGHLGVPGRPHRSVRRHRLRRRGPAAGAGRVSAPRGACRPPRCRRSGDRAHHRRRRRRVRGVVSAPPMGRLRYRQPAHRTHLRHDRRLGRAAHRPARRTLSDPPTRLHRRGSRSERDVPQWPSRMGCLSARTRRFAGDDRRSVHCTLRPVRLSAARPRLAGGVDRRKFRSVPPPNRGGTAVTSSPRRRIHEPCRGPCGQTRNPAP